MGEDAAALKFAAAAVAVASISLHTLASLRCCFSACKGNLKSRQQLIVTCCSEYWTSRGAAALEAAAAAVVEVDKVQALRRWWLEKRCGGSESCHCCCRGGISHPAHNYKSEML